MANYHARGFRFVHDRWLTSDLKTNVVCVITQRRNGVVYFKQADGGSSYYLSESEFDRRFALRGERWMQQQEGGRS